MAGEVVAEAKPVGERTVARACMYTMLGFTSVAHFLTREMGPQLIPFICDAVRTRTQSPPTTR